MKKIAWILTLVMMLSVFAACGSDDEPTTQTSETTAETTTETTAEATEPAAAAPEGTTEELVGKIYENVTVELPLGTIPVDLADADSVAYMTGLSDAGVIKEISVSEPMMGSQAYSLVLVRLNDAADAQTTAQTMFDNIDTRKWICVEATEKQAVVCGDLVMFIMLDPQYGVTTDQIVEAFTTVCGGSVDTVIK